MKARLLPNADLLLQLGPQHPQYDLLLGLVQGRGDQLQYAGFTGERPDSLGRVYRWENGIRVPKNKAEASTAPAAPASITPSPSPKPKTSKDKPSGLEQVFDNDRPLDERPLKKGDKNLGQIAGEALGLDEPKSVLKKGDKDIGKIAGDALAQVLKESQQQLAEMAPRIAAEPVKPVQQHGQANYEKLTAPLAESKLSPERQKKFADGLRKVCGRIPEAAHERIANNTGPISFYPDAKSLAAGMVDDYQRGSGTKWLANVPILGTAYTNFLSIIRDSVVSDKVVGMYNPITKALLLDGASTEEGREDTKHEFLMGKLATETATMVHAHEIGHAIDGPQRELTKTPEWQDAWNTEITPKVPHSFADDRGEMHHIEQAALTWYARTNASEGFAEFARCLYGGGVDLANVEQQFPKCSEFCKQRGLWPTPAPVAPPPTPVSPPQPQKPATPKPKAVPKVAPKPAVPPKPVSPASHIESVHADYEQLKHDLPSISVDDMRARFSAMFDGASKATLAGVLGKLGYPIDGSKEQLKAKLLDNLVSIKVSKDQTAQIPNLGTPKPDNTWKGIKKRLDEKHTPSPIAMSDAYKTLCCFREFQDGLVEIPRLFHEIKKAHPDITAQGFHAEIKRLWDAGDIELHILNEIREAKNSELAIKRDDGSLYYFLYWKPGKAPGDAA